MEGVPVPVPSAAPAPVPSASPGMTSAGRGEMWQWIAILGGFTIITIFIYAMRKEVKLVKLQVANNLVKTPPPPRNP